MPVYRRNWNCGICDQPLLYISERKARICQCGTASGEIHPKLLKEHYVIDSSTLWSCGCETFRDGDRFYIRPCSLGCHVLATAIDISDKTGKQLEVKVSA